MSTPDGRLRGDIDIYLYVMVVVKKKTTTTGYHQICFLCVKKKMVKMVSFFSVAYQFSLQFSFFSAPCSLTSGCLCCDWLTKSDHSTVNFRFTRGPDLLTRSDFSRCGPPVQTLCRDLLTISAHSHCGLPVQTLCCD